LVPSLTFGFFNWVSTSSLQSGINFKKDLSASDFQPMHMARPLHSA
jgi:hypothetical protein